MNLAVVGGANFKKGSNIYFNKIIFQSNGYIKKDLFRYDKIYLGLQDFTLRFFEHNDNLKYKRYKKVLDIISYDNETINMILHKSQTSKIDSFKEYSKINVIKILSHRDVIIDLFKFFSFSELIIVYSLKELIMIVLLLLGLKRKIISNTRPSNGFYNILRMYLQLEPNSQLHCFGFSKPDTKIYKNDYLNFNYRPHQKIDNLIYNKIINNNNIYWNEID